MKLWIHEAFADGSVDYFDYVKTKSIVDNRTDDVNLFFTLTNSQIVRSRSLLYHISYKFMYLSAFWQLANETRKFLQLS